ncbi:hypothetical protein [Paenibacillus agricola]|uniref:HTH merR-type domain-containing protein n=1 Tax=Paenibacillus agricola TaxID=2716264 RepID=A0ABX0JDN1_9BACL|nr:hypothetical protein [Paenibacillus agricola]NHN33364.1 hypothetical protein [Paenibacillus agricola]
MTDHFELYEGHVTIGIAHEKMKKAGISIPIPTLRNWVNDLHLLKIHTIPRNTRDERIFSKEDIDILRFIAEAKQRFGSNVTMQTIGTMLLENFSQHLHYDPHDSNLEHGITPILSEERLKDFLRAELQEISTLKLEMEQSKAKYEEMLRLMPDPVEEAERLKNEIHQQVVSLMPDPKAEALQHKMELRQHDLDRSFTENRIQKRLREKAEEIWNRNPKKTGFIFKKEDTAAKLEFIELYKLDHYEEEMKKEYALANEVNQTNMQEE